VGSIPQGNHKLYFPLMDYKVNYQTSAFLYFFCHEYNELSALLLQVFCAETCDTVLFQVYHTDTVFR